MVSLERPAILIPPRQPLPKTVFWQLSEDLPWRLNTALRVASIAIPLLLWVLISATGWIKPQLLPPPWQVATAFVELWQKGVLLPDAVASIFRVGSGFLLSVVIAIPLGILMGAFASIRALFEPIIGIVRYMPAPAFIPLLIIYMGLEEAPKIALIFIGVLFFNTLMIMDAVKFVPKDLVETTYTLGGSRRQVLFQVMAPYVMPNILDAFRINMAAAWNLVVVAELIAADEGLGKRIELARKFFRTDEIFACLIILGLIGFAIDMFLRWLLRRTCQWSL
jgi:NitT/TauT family transport system permease protein